ncbi:hypothetical protein B0H13DRAFT_2431520 [Mycena leptocephala]|nr:hypothetical protein B0H13DRAFT_2431520 [Mycena leptocephala]
MGPAPSAKRTRNEDVDDAAHNTRLRTEIPQTVALPTFVYTLGPSPVAVSAPVATTTPLPVRTAPPAAPPAPPLSPSAPAQAPPATPNAPPHASAPIPLAPPAAPAAPPRAHAIPQRQAAPQVAPALLVLFSLITWNCDSQNRTQDMVNPLAIVLSAAAHLKNHLKISTRHYKKLSTYTAVASAAPEIANWIVDSWDHAVRYRYAGIYAVLLNA